MTTQTGSFLNFGVLRRAVFCLTYLLFSFTASAAPDPQFSSAAALLHGSQVELLDATIGRYEEIREQGGWQQLEGEQQLIAGTRHPDVRILRHHLRLTGDYTADMSADPLLFDINLTQALMKYQHRHGLVDSGIVDRLTLQTLNIPVEERITQLEHARQQWQQQTLDSVGRSVWVNIPEAQVSLIQAGHVLRNMRAIVGQPSRPTPVVSSSVQRVIVNPTWTVPRSIAVNDLLPQQRADSSYLAANNIRVYSGWGPDAVELDPAAIDWSRVTVRNFNYRLQQDAGPGNALGRIKFDFPNAHDVYLHDTSAQQLLELSYRSLSSGCVRLEEPAVLADWLLAERSTRLQASLEGERTVGIALRQPVPIELVYLSAWVAAADGTVQFRRDIYGLAESDALQVAAVPAATP